MPFTAGRTVLELISEAPAIWIAGAITFLIVGMLAVHGFLTAMSSLSARIAARRRTPPNTRTVTIKQLQATPDYHAATQVERAAVAMLHPTVQLVHENDLGQHTAAIAREIVGEERCQQWPYRHINLEEAADDLRESYTSIKVGPATYYHAVR